VVTVKFYRIRSDGYSKILKYPKDELVINVIIDGYQDKYYKEKSSKFYGLAYFELCKFDLQDIGKEMVRIPVL